MEVDRKQEVVVMAPPAPPVRPQTSQMPPVAYDPRTALPSATAAFTSPQSKRNLEIIAEAIRHLEGDSFVNGGSDYCARNNNASEESLTESSPSDQEDCKSDSSGRNSPMAHAPQLPSHPQVVAAREYSVHVPQTLQVTSPQQLLHALPLAQLPQSNMFNLLQLQRSWNDCATTNSCNGCDVTLDILRVTDRSDVHHFWL